MIKHLLTKLKTMIKLGVVSKQIDDSGDVQIAKISYLGLTKSVSMVSPYGLYSNAPVGTKTALYNILAQEENTIGIPFAQDTRFKNLKPGEILTGNIGTGAFIKFDEDGNIIINSPTKNISIFSNKDTNILTPAIISIVSTGDEISIKSPNRINLQAPSVEIVNGNIDITGGNGTMTVNGNLNMNVNGNANIAATQINLGTSGARIARLGDSVAVDTGTGLGTITSAGVNTSK